MKRWHEPTEFGSGASAINFNRQDTGTQILPCWRNQIRLWPSPQRALISQKLLTRNSIVVGHFQHHSPESLRIDVLDFNRAGYAFAGIQSDR